MMIRVLRNYGGANTRERRIEPGDYAADDPVLFGLAEYLVEYGHAVIVTDAAPPLLVQSEGPVFTTTIGVDDHGNPVKGQRRPITDKDLHPDRPAEPTASSDAIVLTGNGGDVGVIEIDLITEPELDMEVDGDRDAEDPTQDDADYQAMTKGQLLNIAAAGGLELSDRLTKQAIIDALNKHWKSE